MQTSEQFQGLSQAEDAGQAAVRAGAFLVNVATFLDKRPD